MHYSCVKMNVFAVTSWTHSRKEHSMRKTSRRTQRAFDPDIFTMATVIDVGEVTHTVLEHFLDRGSAHMGCRVVVGVTLAVVNDLADICDKDTSSPLHCISSTRIGSPLPSPPAVKYDVCMVGRVMVHGWSRDGT